MNRQLISRFSARVLRFSFYCIVAFLLLYALLIWADNAFRPAKRLASLSNLKQLIFATNSYCTDYEGGFPIPLTYDKSSGGGPALKKALSPYVMNKDIFTCTLTSWEDPFTPTENETKDFSFVNSYSFQKWKKNGRVNMSSIVDPETAAYLRSPIRGFGSETRDGVTKTGFTSPVGFGLLVGYADGHAKHERPIPVDRL